MIPPNDCPYSGLTAKPCWQCKNYRPEIDECILNYIASSAADTTAARVINTSVWGIYEERLRQYEEDRRKLLELSKEALVDLILHRPTMY